MSKKNSGIFNQAAILPMSDKSGKIQQTFTCTLTSAGKKVNVLATAAQGTVELNLSDEQDFNGTSYVTVFGRSVHSLVVDCLETTDCSKGYKSEFATMATRLKAAIDSGSLPFITLKYAGSSLSISGYVARIDFKLNPPYRYFTLHVQGTF